MCYVFMQNFTICYELSKIFLCRFKKNIFESLKGSSFGKTLKRKQLFLRSLNLENVCNMTLKSFFVLSNI